MSNQERGRNSGQHQQSAQQATMFASRTPATIIDYGPEAIPLFNLEEWISATFEHADRIQFLDHGEWRE